MHSEAYSEPSETSKIKCVAKIDAWEGSGNATVIVTMGNKTFYQLPTFLSYWVTKRACI